MCSQTLLQSEVSGEEVDWCPLSSEAFMLSVVWMSMTKPMLWPIMEDPSHSWWQSVLCLWGLQHEHGEGIHPNESKKSLGTLWSFPLECAIPLLYQHLTSDVVQSLQHKVNCPVWGEMVPVIALRNLCFQSIDWNTAEWEKSNILELWVVSHIQ